MDHEQLHDALTAPEATNVTVRVQELVRLVQDELRQLLRQRADVTGRIGTLKKTVSGLATLFGESVLSDELKELVDKGKPGRERGFTRTCRSILMEADAPMSARQVCDLIIRQTPSLLERHKDPLASVTTVLNRLVDYGEAQRVVLNDNRRGWRWVVAANGSGDVRSGTRIEGLIGTSVAATLKQTQTIARKPAMNP